MKTVLIYGAPGVGKLTVAKELSKVTGFNLLHNHLLNDLIKSVFEFGSENYLKTVHKYRLDLMERASTAKNKGIILTFVYAKLEDDPYLKKIVQQARKHEGEIIFIHLVCDKKELLKRVKNPSRKLFFKIKTHKKLNKMIERYNIFNDVPYQPNFTIDNTKLSPTITAKLIKNTANL